MIALAPRLLLRRLCIVSLVGFFSYGAVATVSTAGGLDVLQVSGSVKQEEGQRALSFNVDELEALGVSQIKTSTPWTEGQPVFEGILMSDLLKAVEAKGETVVAIALNDYRVEIPISDFRKYPVILAYRMNGQRLKVRDKGPFWIIYPQDEYPALKEKKVQSRWVWQLRELAIR